MGIWKYFLCQDRVCGVSKYSNDISYTNSASNRISVPSQAFLAVSNAQNPALTYGAVGLLGLGFDSLSNIDAYVNSTGASTGRSLLYNLFQDNPSEPNFIALSLQSTSDGDQVTGSFAIGKFTALLLYALVDASECRRD